MKILASVIMAAWTPKKGSIDEHDNLYHSVPSHTMLKTSQHTGNCGEKRNILLKTLSTYGEIFI